MRFACSRTIVSAFLGVQVDRWVDRHRVAGVHAGALDVLHDAGDQHGLAVADGVDFDLAAVEVLVDQDGLPWRHRRPGADGCHELAVAFCTTSIARPPSTYDGRTSTG